MNLFELFVKIGVDDQASGKLKDLGGKLGNGLKTAAKIGTAAVTAAAAGITALTTAAVNNYAEYEQLVGGVQTLFGAGGQSIEEYAKATGKSVDKVKGEYDKLIRSQEAVISNADRAYRTAGMSVNEYMSTVTSFSASLLQGLGGDTEKAAKIADKAITDMSDNANKMGTSIEMIQNAYQGFAKQNYTMLDNLKLGYGGTASEMARLINDSGVLGKKIKVEAKTVNSVSFDKIIEAIGVMQDRMGITGTTAKEAGATIAGSVGAMKSAWTNLITGLADGNADIGKLIDNLVTTIVGDGTKENLGVIGNILPAIERALGGAVKLIEGAAPKIIEILPGLVEDLLPTLISSATDLVGAFTDVLPSLLSTVIDAVIENGPMLIDAAVGLIDALITAFDDNYEMIIEGAGKIIEHLVSGLISLLPKILETGLNVLVSLADGIAQNIDTLIPTVMDVIFKIVSVLTKSDAIQKIIDAAFVIIDKLAWGIGDALPELVDAILLIVDKIVSVLLKPENLAKIIQSSFQITLAITQGLINAIPNLLKGVETIILDIVAQFKDADWEQIGKDLVAGFKKGIKNAWSNMKRWFKNLFGDLVSIAKNILGIHSPSRVFKSIGGFTAQGFGIGFEDEFAHVKDDMEDALNFEDASVGINASVRKIGAGTAGGAFGGTNFNGDIIINVNGDKYHDENALAEALAVRLQGMTDRRAAVFDNG